MEELRLWEIRICLRICIRKKKVVISIVRLINNRIDMWYVKVESTLLLLKDKIIVNDIDRVGFYLKFMNLGSLRFII